MTIKKAQTFDIDGVVVSAMYIDNKIAYFVEEKGNYTLIGTTHGRTDPDRLVAANFLKEFNKHKLTFSYIPQLDYQYYEKALKAIAANPEILLNRAVAEAVLNEAARQRTDKETAGIAYPDKI